MTPSISRKQLALDAFARKNSKFADALDNGRVLDTHVIHRTAIKALGDAQNLLESSNDFKRGVTYFNKGRLDAGFSAVAFDAVTMSWGVTATANTEPQNIVYHSTYQTTGTTPNDETESEAETAAEQIPVAILNSTLVVRTNDRTLCRVPVSSIIKVRNAAASSAETDGIFELDQIKDLHSGETLSILLECPESPIPLPVGKFYFLQVGFRSLGVLSK
jgi:hypothetical protein